MGTYRSTSTKNLPFYTNRDLRFISILLFFSISYAITFYFKLICSTVELIVGGYFD